MAEHAPDPLAERIARDTQRRKKAESEPRSNLWTQVARVGTLGWLIALPIVAGALLGHALDRVLGTGITWALALMMLGIVVGAYVIWRELRGKV